MTWAAPDTLHVLVDLTELPREALGTLPDWPSADRFTVRSGRVTCVLPPGRSPLRASPAPPSHWTFVTSASAIPVCSDVMKQAADEGASLLLLQGCMDVTDEARFALRRALASDPMTAAAVARVQCQQGCCIRTPVQGVLGRAVWSPRETLADVPQTEMALECVDLAVLLRTEILSEFGSLDAQFAALGGAMVHFLARARRCGFRVVMANRAVVSGAGVTCSQPPVAAVRPEDRDRLCRLVPEHERGWTESRRASTERLEHLGGRARRVRTQAGRPSLLLDIRNVGALHNGTSQAVLGSAHALYRANEVWETIVLAHSAAVQFHQLERAWPRWRLGSKPPREPFTAALRLSQPWHIEEMIDLHEAALFNAYVMLDTISWDVVYPPPPRLDGTWSFLADHADGLLFDSAFTEQRFLARFPVAAHVRRAVCHYPFAAAEYQTARRSSGSPGFDVLVVGNELDHKDAVRTLDLLSSAFPFRRLVSLGPKIRSAPNLEVHRSGGLAQQDIERLYEEARFVVFPSFYEGFGFPIVTALARGKTVIARESALLDEIAARCTTGTLIAFQRRDELVDILGRLLQGGVVSAKPIGAAAGESRRGWIDVGRDLAAFLDELVREPAAAHWRHRERAVSQLRAFRMA